MNGKILLVDDDANILAGFERTLRKDFDITVSNSPETAVRMFESAEPFAVVVADMRMGVMDGAQFLAKVGEVSPTSVRVMLTGQRDLETAMTAVNQGHVFRFLTKPISGDELKAVLAAAIEYHYSMTAEKELLQKTLRGFAQMLTELFAVADPESFGRTRHVWKLAEPLAKAAKVTKLWEIETAVMLARMGNVTIPTLVLAKHRGNGRLSDFEKQMIQNAPSTAHDLIRTIPRLDRVAEMILYQDKHFDGSGLPNNNIAGDDIPLGARILKLAQDLDILLDGGGSREESLDALRRRAGVYDPKLLELAASCLLNTKKEFPSVSRWLPLSALKLGDTLLGDIETVDGVRLLASGLVITQANFTRIANFSKVHNIREPVHVLSNYPEPAVAAKS